MEVDDSTRVFSLDFNISSFSRVISLLFDFRKYWYVFKKEICGVRLADFLRNEIFRRFFDEIRSVVI